MTLQKSIAEKMRRIITHCEQLEMLASLLPKDWEMEAHTLLSSARINIPLSLKVLRQVRRQLPVGWRLRSVYEITDGWGYSYHHPDYDVELDIWTHANMEGSTCRLVQVGIREKPIYKAVCQ